ncbi:Splicing_factor U2AF subunit [Hexamita inflata]|uniref:Putative n=1 Tax=Hexamita inflata TaxID=28002 RepID=A0AA86UNM2_9EUKA|nr:Splicing factor U2AF subunit [Hexamita inflata]
MTCEFYDKTGCCKHGHNCSRPHPVLELSNTLIFEGVCPAIRNVSNILQVNFWNNVYEDLFLRCDEFGFIQDCALSINQNHLFGTFFVQFKNLNDAQKCYETLKNQQYAGKTLKLRFGPMNTLRKGVCIKNLQKRCNDECNYIHQFDARDVAKELFAYNDRWR